MELKLLYFVGVLTLGIAAQWIAWRLRLPAILVLLLCGFAAGQVADPAEMIGEELVFPLVSLAVSVILFEGSLTLSISELRLAGRSVFQLVTVGVLVTWALTALAAWWLLDFHPAMASLLGAILVVSGPTVIVPLMRHVRPLRRIGAVVKWEGIVNDPVGVVLAVMMFSVLFAQRFEEVFNATFNKLVVSLGVGLAIGVVAAVLLVQVLKRFWVPDFLQNPVTLATVVAAFAASDYFAPESGLVAVTIMGVMLANQKSIVIKHVLEFKENLQVLLISTLFIVLASMLKVEDVLKLGIRGPIFLLVLLVIRVVAVFVSTLGTKLTLSEKLFLCCMHPRGIVAAAISSLFALDVIYYVAEGRLPASMSADAERLVPVTFLVIVGTVAVYGLSASPIARLLKVNDPNPQGILFAGAAPFVRAIAKVVHDEGYPVMLVDTNYFNLQSARMAGLPTVQASILSEYVQEADLSGIGRLLAMTPNREVNTLAALEFSHNFGRAEVYRLSREPTSDEGRQDPVSRQVRARVLFADEATYAYLAGRIANGSVVKKTTLSEEFDYDDFREMYGPSALLLFVISKSGELSICTMDRPLSPKPGQTLISLVDKPREVPAEKNHASAKTAEA